MANTFILGCYMNATIIFVLRIFLQTGFIKLVLLAHSHKYKQLTMIYSFSI